MRERADSFQLLGLGLKCENIKHVYKYRTIDKLESQNFQSKPPCLPSRGSHGAILMHSSYRGTERD